MTRSRLIKLAGALAALLLLAQCAPYQLQAPASDPGPAYSPVISTQQLRLVDPQGNIRAALLLTEGGEPELELYDGDGNTRFALGLAGGKGPGLILKDSDGKPRTVLFMSDDGGPSISLLNAEGEVASTLGLLQDGRPFLRLAGTVDNAGMFFYIGQDGLPAAIIVGEGGKLIWSVPERMQGPSGDPDDGAGADAGPDEAP